MQNEDVVGRYKKTFPKYESIVTLRFEGSMKGYLVFLSVMRVDVWSVSRFRFLDTFPQKPVGNRLNMFLI